MNFHSTKNYIISFLLLVNAFALTSAAAQSKQSKPKPDFSGMWLLDRKKSNIGDSTRPDKPIKIVHRDPELRITHSFSASGQSQPKEFVYYTDGRGESNQATAFLSTGVDFNPQAHDKDVAKSKTKWSGDKVITRSPLRSVIAGRVMEFEMIDEWKLSKDGQTLTQTSRTVFLPDTSDAAVFIPARRADTKRVYNRVPD